MAKVRIVKGTGTTANKVRLVLTDDTGRSLNPNVYYSGITEALKIIIKYFPGFVIQDESGLMKAAELGIMEQAEVSKNPSKVEIVV